MKVTAKNISLPYDDREAIEITFDDKLVFSAYDGEPEDSTLSRNFADCYDILDLLQQVYKLGQEGKEVVFVEQERKWDDEYEAELEP